MKTLRNFLSNQKKKKERKKERKKGTAQSIQTMAKIHSSAIHLNC